MTSYYVAAFDDCCHLYVTKDLGVTWFESVVAPDANWNDAAMALNDGDKDAILAIADSGFVSQSTLTETFNDPPVGAGWTDLSGTITEGSFDSCSMSTEAGIYIINNENIYPLISRDAGATWVDLTTVPVLGPGRVYQKSCMSANVGFIYMTGNTTTYPIKSADQGATWTQLTGFPTSTNNTIWNRIRCSQDGSVVVMVAENHASLTNLYISTDFGVTWNSVNLLTEAGSVGGFLKWADFNMTLDGSTIFVGFYNNTTNYFLLSTDTGTTWNILSLPYGSAFPVFAVGISSDANCLSAFYANDHTTAFADISSDGGATWATKSFSLTNKPEGAPGDFVAAWIVPFNPTPPPPPFSTPRGGYIIERLDNRIWPTVENVWAVDCGFTLAQPTPDADLQIIPVP